jgi:hypothetical protein
LATLDPNGSAGGGSTLRLRPLLNQGGGAGQR